jgi:NADH-quinone oxidoreductase subunit I/NAD(P)H-quinone oxidoreductase subunit I
MSNALRDYAAPVIRTFTSIWDGLSITLSHLLRRPTTIQYPDRTDLHVRDMLPPRYRGFLEVDTAICTGCQACERACPISVIAIRVEKDPAHPGLRFVTQFDIDLAKCMFCGLCVEPCPTGAIQHTREFEGSQRHVRNLVVRWANPMKPFPVYKVVKGADHYPRAVLGTLVRSKLESHHWDAPAPEYLPPEPPALAPPPPSAVPTAVHPERGAGSAGAESGVPATPTAPADKEVK